MFSVLVIRLRSLRLLRVSGIVMRLRMFFFFFNDTATTEIYTLSLHDALPISCPAAAIASPIRYCRRAVSRNGWRPSRVKTRDRESTRLNSSHANISYAVFCLKKKKFVWQLAAARNFYEGCFPFW